MTEEGDFGVDGSKKSGRKSHCKACDRERERAKRYYDAHRDGFYARREAIREAERQEHLKELEKRQKKRIAAVRREAEAGRRRQAKLLAELGLPDPTPEEVQAQVLGDQVRPSGWPTTIPDSGSGSRRRAEELARR